MSDDDFSMSRRRTRQEIETLRDLLEKTNKSEREYDNIRGQIAMLRRLLRPDGLDSKREFEGSKQPSNVNGNPTPTPTLY